MFKLNVIQKQGHQIKIYTNAANSVAVIFFPFGRYTILRSDRALDFATDFLMNSSSAPVVINFQAYQTSMEDTQITLAA